MTHHVQIIDDTPINLALFEALVKKLDDCVPHCFVDAIEGLTWAQTHSADLIIVDYMMPKLDGISLIERLRASPGCADVPILMITANDEKEVRYRALSVGATDFLTKPIDRIEFLARAANLLALSQARRQLSDRASWLAEEVRKATVDVRMRELESVIRLSKAAEFRDPETGAHILRMAHYSHLIAGGLGLPADDLDLLLHAAPLHDIGKVGIADNILLKPGRLTAEEFEIMKKHATFGHEILQGSASPYLRAGAEIAYGHHEKFDGSGYPQGLSGKNIPLFSRIVAVADVFDALTSERPYKKAWTLEAASSHIQSQSGIHFDPDCVDVFFAKWDDVLRIRSRFSDEDESDVDLPAKLITVMGDL